ncbi:hypothetical protein [Halonotius sp. GCM10025705]|uniref:hypothetical protein n=1 Tax=Halonotius sp. GCM10025705 TaxID=3252678 RepID=UPI003616511B
MNTDDMLEGQSVHFPTETVQLSERIGSGAAGTVHHVEGDESTVVKIFSKDKRDEKADKIQAMVENPPQDPTFEQTGERSILWPEAVGEDPETGEFLGYRMPFRDLKKINNAHSYARTELNWDTSTPQERYGVAHNLAVTVAAIREQGHAIGDFNHGNIFVDEDGFVTLIDCDGFYITTGNTSYPHDIFSSRYTPLAGLDSVGEIDIETNDCFGLSVHIFQLLMEGFHPFQAQGFDAVAGSFEDMIQNNQFPYGSDTGKIRPPEQAPNYEQIPEPIRQLFSNCFSTPAMPYLYCPKPNDWIETLERQLSDRPCEVDCRWDWFDTS